MNKLWIQNREQERQNLIDKIYWSFVITVSALTVIAAAVIGVIALLQPAPIDAEPPATAAPPTYIAAAAYIEPEQTTQPTPEPTPAPTHSTARYEMTAAERDIVERTVMAEGGNTEDLTGLMYVAQCLLNGCERSDVRPDKAAELYQYAPPAPKVNEKVREAVHRVFDLGETVTDEPVLFFYAPKYVRDGVSKWHESLSFVAEHGGHRFFTLEEHI